MTRIDKDNWDELWEKELQDAEMVLVGLGEEFDAAASAQEEDMAEQVLRAKGLDWLIPELKARQSGNKEFEEKKLTSLEQLARQLGRKNYYVVSLTRDHRIEEIPWREGRLVSPPDESGEEKKDTGKAAEREEKEGVGEAAAGEGQEGAGKIAADEKRIAWEKYEKWLFGSLNRKLLILRLGTSKERPAMLQQAFENMAQIHPNVKYYAAEGEGLEETVRRMAEKEG